MGLWIALLLAFPSVALAADGQDAGIGGAVAVGTAAAAESARRQRRKANVKRGHQADAIRHGWSAERARVEELAAHRAAARRKRRAG